MNMLIYIKKIIDKKGLNNIDKIKILITFVTIILEDF